MIALKLAVVALLAVHAQSISLRQDEACTNQGGSCVNWQYYVCHGGVETGLCNGDSNIRCCLPCDDQCQADEDEWSQGDAACTAEGGECKLDSNYCDGVYEGGLCGGPAERSCCKAPNGDCPAIVSRAEWGARAPGSTTYMGNGVQYLFIHHSAGASCSTKSECIAEVKGIQNYHMDSNGWSEVGYSFLIGGDGNVYEGRGWNKVGAQTYGFNSVGYGIDFIGTFTSTNPTQAAQDAFKQLAECAAAGGYVIGDYELKGHRQTGSTECPGNTFYETIKSYPHWTNGNIGKDMTMDEETRRKYMEL
eukprot:TCALIF_04450-PA protein Name:"Similar to PGRP-SC2 Peptidoglycan-recognition protein SC2 (Drosophila melanogaster)" AED:0.37 eAED:0.37 QI:5/1/0.88/1/1/1/9/247/304